MTPDMADAHETARARDAQTLHAYLTPADPQPGDEVIYLGPAYSTRTHAINPTTGEFTRLDQEDTMTKPQTKTEWLAGIAVESHRTNELLAEIRDRLPEREVACGDVWRDETERPCTRPSGHDGNHVDKAGTIWANPEPAPADVDPDEALAKVLEVVGERPGGDYFALARAAREHIEAEQEDAVAFFREEVECQTARAEKLEADLARVTEERDRLHGSCRALDVGFKKYRADSEHRLALLRAAETERDGWRTKAQRIWNATHSWLATIEPDDGGSMKVTRGRRGALINTIDRHWWSEPFFNPESPMRDTERAES